MSVLSKKMAEQLGYPEPSFSTLKDVKHPDYSNEYRKYLKHFSYFHNTDQIVSIAIEFLKKIRCNLDYKRMPVDAMLSIGKIVNLYEKVGVIQQSSKDFLKEKIKFLKEFNDKLLPEISKKVVSLKEIKAKKFFTELEGKIDDKNYNAFESIPVSQEQLLNYISPRIKELEEVLSSEPSELRQGYIGQKKKDLIALLNFYKNLIEVPTVAENTKKEIVDKPSDLSEVVYQKRNDELGLKSLKPEKILTAKSEVVLFNTEYRKLIVLKGSKFTIRGTTIYGFDNEISYTQMIRKPLDFFNKKFNPTTTQAFGKATGRLSEQVIIISAK